VLQFPTPIEQLAYETVALFHRMKLVVQQLHGGGEMAAGKRGILKGIEIRGPQTIPQMARARPVSRQHIRAVVEPLVAEGLVEYADNPDHKRSKIVRMTPAGLARLEEINRREKKFFARLGAEFDPQKLAEAAETLRALRELLAGREWGTGSSKPRRRKRRKE
jgi:DNA-binding MarR family transcriptional regulator